MQEDKGGRANRNESGIKNQYRTVMARIEKNRPIVVPNVLAIATTTGRYPMESVLDPQLLVQTQRYHIPEWIVLREGVTEIEIEIANANGIGTEREIHTTPSLSARKDGIETVIVSIRDEMVPLLVLVLVRVLEAAEAEMQGDVGEEMGIRHSQLTIGHWRNAWACEGKKKRGY